MKTLFFSMLIVVAGCLVGSWYWLGGGMPDATPQFRELAVSRGPLLLAVGATGTIEPVEVVDVGAQILGRIASFGDDPHRPGKTVDFGSRVTEGMVIAQIDDSPYKAELAQASADASLAKAELDKAQAALTQAERDFARAEQLRDSSPAAEYEKALSAVEIAKADVAVAEARIEQANVKLQTAEINLGYTVIKSPINGIVIDRRVNVGQTVVAGLNAPSLFLIAENLDTLQVWAAVNEADIGQIHVGQPVTFRVDAYRDQVFKGEVTQIRLNASMTHNVVTYGVIVLVDNPDGKLLPYMTANLQFEVAKRDQAQLVPNQALRWRPTWDLVDPQVRDQFKLPTEDPSGEPARIDYSESLVWVRSGENFVRPIPVEAGLSDGVSTEITTGELEDGQAVIVSAVKKPSGDFASTFLSRITGPKKDDSDE